MPNRCSQPWPGTAPSWVPWTTQTVFPAWALICKAFQQDQCRALLVHDTFTSSILRTVKNFLTRQDKYQKWGVEKNTLHRYEGVNHCKLDWNGIPLSPQLHRTMFLQKPTVSQTISTVSMFWIISTSQNSLISELILGGGPGAKMFSSSYNRCKWASKNTSCNPGLLLWTQLKPDASGAV